MPFVGTIKRTYSKKQESVPQVNKKHFGDKYGKENYPKININSSLDESYWKDSFDKLLDDKKYVSFIHFLEQNCNILFCFRVLRQKKVIKKKINASYNRDSSKEVDDLGLPDLFARRNKRRRPTSGKYQNTKKSRPAKSGTAKTRKRKIATHFVVGDAVVSTPVGGKRKKAKQSNNLSFNISPIGSGKPIIRFPDILTDSSHSNIIFPLKIMRTGHKPKLFDKNLITSPVMGERRVQLNLDHDSVKELMISCAKAVNASNEALTGKSIIEISHTDEEILDQILKTTNPQTLIQLALIPRNSLTEVLEQSMKRNEPSQMSLDGQPAFTHITHRKTSKSKKSSISDQLSADSGLRSDSPDFNGFDDSSMLNTVEPPPLKPCVGIEKSLHDVSIPILDQEDTRTSHVTHRKTKSSDKSSKRPSKSPRSFSIPLMISDKMDRIDSVSPDFYGFDNTCGYEMNKETSCNLEMSQIQPTDPQRTSPDLVREFDIRTNMTAGTIGFTENLIPDRISLNYLNKTPQIVEEEIDESISSNIVTVSFKDASRQSMKSLESIHVEDSPRCSRNYVTQGVVDVSENYAVEYNDLSKTTSPKNLPENDEVPMETDIVDVSVIPATPVHITTRRRTRAKSALLGNNQSNKWSIAPSNLPHTIPDDNESVIDCTFTEQVSQRRLTRRLTKKNVQFMETRPSLDAQATKMRLHERKTVAFEPSTIEPPVEPSISIRLAPGKWRKSLAAWKRKTSALSMNAINNETAVNDSRLSKAEISTKKISGVRKSDGRWLSSVGRMTIQEDDESDEDTGEFIFHCFSLGILCLDTFKLRKELLLKLP